MSNPSALSSFAGKRIMVTGGSGFVGSRLVTELLSVDCSVLLVTRSLDEPTPVPAERGLCERLRGDIGEQALWANALPGVDFVFHFAAQTSVYTADQNPVDDWSANVQPMLHLLETCRESGWRPRILFAGSATEVGIPERVPVDETHPDRPITVYDWHKLLAETYLGHYVRQGWARGATLRLANIYGPGPVSGAKDRGVLNQIMRRALRGETLTIYGSGHHVRDYLFIDDAVEAFLAAGANLDRVDGRHYVLGSGTGHTLADAFRLVAAQAMSLTGREVPVTHVDPPAGLSPIENRDFVADTSRFRAATGWRPRTDLADGVERTLVSLLAELPLADIRMMPS